MSSDADLRARLDERLRAALESSDPNFMKGGSPPGELTRFGLSAGGGPLGRQLLLFKRVQRRLLREVLARQSVFNAETDRQLQGLRSQAASTERELRLQAESLRALERRIALLEVATSGGKEARSEEPA